MLQLKLDSMELTHVLSTVATEQFWDTSMMPYSTT